MTRQIVFATSNKHKAQEVSDILGDEFQLLNLQDIGCTVELPETQETIEGNAKQKAEYVYAHFKLDCFSEDTGLEVQALNGEPGVHSARYGGAERSDQSNMDLLLSRLEPYINRKARFKTVIALIEGGQIKIFEGIINGVILEAKKGNQGFGYDPIFQPEGYDKSFAELGKAIKNKISHRAIAVNKLVEYLQSTGRSAK